MLRTQVPVRYKNPHASEDLVLGLDVIENTPSEAIEANTRANARKYHNWLQAKDVQGSAILIGGGGSINDHIEDIQNLQSDGATVFAMNGASQWARAHGITPDYQVILDAKPETAGLVDPLAGGHLFSSQCDPMTTAAADNLTLWHLDRPGVEDLLPAKRVKEGGYCIVGGDASVGICALCLVYTQGFRDFHIFGYDTSYRDGKGHGYKQRINDTMPTIETNWAGKGYTISIAMKDQCQNFMAYSQALKDMGCAFTVYGEGLLQSVYRTDVSSLSEQDKYRLMWMFPVYRDISPGANVVQFFIDKFNPSGKIIDFGCGTGKAAVKMKEAGLQPLLIDFADNCRDPDADFPFLEWDLTDPIPAETEYGFCADVMEHIPQDDVGKVIDNIMASSEKVFFQISTVDDLGGDLIGATLHHTVNNHNWWLDQFSAYTVEYDQDLGIASVFYVVRD